MPKRSRRFLNTCGQYSLNLKCPGRFSLQKIKKRHRRIYALLPTVRFSSQDETHKNPKSLHFNGLKSKTDDLQRPPEVLAHFMQMRSDIQGHFRHKKSFKSLPATSDRLENTCGRTTVHSFIYIIFSWFICLCFTTARLFWAPLVLRRCVQVKGHFTVLYIYLLH